MTESKHHPISILDPNRPVLPEWTRWAWSSMQEREYWGFLIQRAAQTYVELERIAVVKGIRSACYQTVNVNGLVQLNGWALKNNLLVVPIDQKNTTDNYQSGSSELDPNKPIEYRVLIIRPEMLLKIQNAKNIANDNELLGEVLGYPKCCRDFFMRTWGAGQVDTTWDQYATTFNAFGPVEANILWRWKGIRWVSHLPCSFQCEATVQQGRLMRQLAKEEGFFEEAHTIDTVLSWPVKWSGVNGIAEIVSPTLKISTRTDWAPPSDNRVFERSGMYHRPTSKNWELNGFSSFAGMYNSHTTLIQNITEFVPVGSTVFDLGCGSGALLRRLKMHRSDIKIAGVDSNEEAIILAKTYGIGEWYHEKIQNLPLRMDITVPFDSVPVYSPVRLLEMNDEERTRTLEYLLKFKQHIVYVYGDHLQKTGLDGWVAQSGLPLGNLLVSIDGMSHNIAVGVIAT